MSHDLTKAVGVAVVCLALTSIGSAMDDVAIPMRSPGEPPLGEHVSIPRRSISHGRASHGTSITDSANRVSAAVSELESHEARQQAKRDSRRQQTAAERAVAEADLRGEIAERKQKWAPLDESLAKFREAFEKRLDEHVGRAREKVNELGKLRTDEFNKFREAHRTRLQELLKKAMESQPETKEDKSKEGEGEDTDTDSEDQSTDFEGAIRFALLLFGA